MKYRLAKAALQIFVILICFTTDALGAPKTAARAKKKPAPRAGSVLICDAEYYKNLLPQLLADSRRQPDFANVSKSLKSMFGMRSTQVHELLHTGPGLAEEALEWSLVSRKTVGEKLQLTIQNAKTAEVRKFSIPWDPLWEARETSLLKAAEIDFGDLKIGTNAERNRQTLGAGHAPEAKAWIAAGDASSAIAERALETYESVTLDLLARHADELAKTDPGLPQYLLQDAIRAKLTSQVLKGQPIRTLVPFLSGPYTLSWSKLFPTRSGEFRNYVRRHGGSGDVWATIIDPRGAPRTRKLSYDEAFDLFRVNVAFQAQEARFRSGADYVFGSSLAVVGSKGVPAFHYINGGLLKDAIQHMNVAPQYRTLLERVRKHWRAGYKNEFGASDAFLDEIEKFSADAEERTHYFVMTKQNHAQLQPKRIVQDHPILGKRKMQVVEEKNFDHFDVLGSLSFVVAEKGQYLPMNRLSIPVTHRTNLPIAEMGRFYIDEAYRKDGARQIWKMCSTFASTQKLERIVAHTNETYAQELISRYGYRKMGERTNHFGKKEILIEITPDELFRNSTAGK